MATLRFFRLLTRARFIMINSFGSKSSKKESLVKECWVTDVFKIIFQLPFGNLAFGFKVWLQHNKLKEFTIRRNASRQIHFKFCVFEMAGIVNQD